MTQPRVYTNRNERYVLPGGVQQPIYEVDVEKPSSLTNAVQLLLELHKTLREFHSAGGAPQGAATVDFSAQVPAGKILFVPLFLGRDEEHWPISVPDAVARLPQYGLRLATPYETLWWFRKELLESINKRRPNGLESSGVFAFGSEPKSRALLITQMSCRIMYILGRRRPDYYPMTDEADMPYLFSIATVVTVPTVVRANQYVRRYTPILPGAA